VPQQRNPVALIAETYPCDIGWACGDLTLQTEQPEQIAKLAAASDIGAISCVALVANGLHPNATIELRDLWLMLTP
jgi:hypothetical protein